MYLDVFISELANGDSNDREIDCLTAALREAFERIPAGADTEAFETLLEAILEEN
jgi:hypothetical protein